MPLPEYTFSIKSFILKAVLSAITVVMLIAAIYIYIATRKEINEIFDARLAQSARVMDQLLNNYLDSRKSSETVEAPEWLSHQLDDPNVWHSYERKLYFQILNEKKEIILKSPHAPDKALSDLTLGFNHIVLKDFDDDDQRKWNTFTLKNKNANRWLIAAERNDVRTELTDQIARISFFPILLSLIILAFLLIFILKKGLLPIDQLTKKISQRSPTDFSPFVAERVTQELKLLYREMNRLLMSQQLTLEREKQFTDAAAHELRTPLAVLKINAENALNAKEQDEQKKSLEKLVHGIDRSSRLIQQLLVLARLENPKNISMSTISLNELLQEVIAELTPLALRKQQQIELEIDDNAYTLLSNGPLLNILFSNLIDNAIRYTPDGGFIMVQVSRKGDCVLVSVIDDGGGVEPHQLHRLGEAFFRADSGKGDGTGLGLSIVRRISELLSMSVQFYNRQPKGFVARITLPISNSSPLI